MIFFAISMPTLLNQMKQQRNKISPKECKIFVSGQTQSLEVLLPLDTVVSPMVLS